MSSNIKQIYDSNPASSLNNDDLIYLGRSPYSTTNDMAIKSQSIFPSSVAVSGTLASYSDTTGKKLSDSGIRFSGAYTFVGTLTANTTVTFPTSGTLATTSQIPSFPLSLANGGTNANLTASVGGIVYSTSGTLDILPGTAQIQRVLMSGNLSAPSWSSTIYPATTTINRILFSIADNQIGELSAVGGSVLGSTPSGEPIWIGTMTDGQLVIGSTGNEAMLGTLTAGTGISITNGSGSITVSVIGGGSAWNEISSTSATMDFDNGYITNNAALVTLTLPSTAPLGTEINVIGKGAGGWSIVLNTGQSIQVGSSATTVTTGSVSSTNRYDSLKLICTTANTIWTALGAPQGSLTIM